MTDSDDGEGQSPLKSPGPIDPAKGYWPPWHRKFFNDFRTAENAKANDGMVAPDVDLAVLTPANADRDLFDAACRRHDQAQDRIKVAEQRAQRLAQWSMSLITILLVALGYEASHLRTRNAPFWVWLIVCAIAVAGLICLALSLVQAVGVDRVGYVHPAEPKEVSALDPTQRLSNLTGQELRAAEVADWSGRKKVNEFLQARAWFTRGVVLLLLVGLTTVAVWSYASQGSTRPDPSRHCPALRSAGGVFRCDPISHPDFNRHGTRSLRRVGAGTAGPPGVTR